MRRCMAALLVMALLGCGTLARAEDSECDCDCKKGGLGIVLAGFVCGFGFKQYNTVYGCDRSIGVGIGVGGERGRVQIGAGFTEGVLGLGLGVRGSEKTTIVGFSIGYDYGDCRMVWPIKE